MLGVPSLFFFLPFLLCSLSVVAKGVLAEEEIASFQKVYVSSSEGSDANTGSTEEYPLKTLSVALKKGAEIYLKAGDIFYGNILLTNKKLLKYGNGDNPAICGYKRIIVPNWISVGKNIWKIDLTADNYSGVSFKGENFLNNIGCIHEYDTNKLHGRKMQFFSELKQNWDIWQTESFSKKDTSPSSFNYLYLYYTGNPNELKLEFSTGSTGIQASNAIVSNIDVRGFGKHGIAAGTNTLIEYCNIDVIGGTMQVGYSSFVCLGNGIEFYVSKNISNSMVRKCKISRCYDCGVTIQGSGHGQATPSNIEVYENCIENCCQGWEDFLRNDTDVKYLNCVFRDNIVINSGKSLGFGYPKGRFKYCHVLGNNIKGNKGMIIRNNVFIGGNYYCSGAYQKKYQSNIWKNNICYIEPGYWILSNYTGQQDVIYIPVERGKHVSLKKATEHAISEYRNLTGDQTTVFKISSRKEIQKKIRDYKNKFCVNK